MPTEKSIREPKLWEALLPFIAMVTFLILGVVYKISLEIVLIFAATVAALIAKRVGFSFEAMLEMYRKKISDIFIGILILITIGIVVGTWMFSGTVPLLIYYGLSWLNPKFVPVFAFAITALVSLFTGTSWGSAATSGVAFMGIAKVLGIPLDLVAGAVISGAFLGDKFSAVSDTTNIAALSSNVNVYDHIKGMSKNVIISGCVALVFYLVYSFFMTTDTSLNVGSIAMLEDLDRMYNFNVLLLLPAVIVFGGSYFRYNPILLMLAGSFVALLLGIFVQGFSFQSGAVAAVSGFNISMFAELGIDPTSFQSNLGSLLNRGGMQGMISGAVLFCFCAVSFGSIMDGSGCFRVILKHCVGSIRSVRSLVYTTFFSGAVLNSTTSNSQFSMMTLGQMFDPLYNDHKVAKTWMSRSMENSMTLLEGVIPWTVTGVYMATTLGVSTLDYLPFAVFNLMGMGVFLIQAAFLPKSPSQGVK